MSDWQKAEGKVFLHQGKPLRPMILRKAVKEAGFTPTWLEVKAAGILMKKNNSLVLWIEEIPQEFFLVGNKAKEVEKLIDKKIVVTGNVQEEKANLIISVKNFEFNQTIEDAERREN